MSGAEIAHELKVLGDGSELRGVVNVFKTGVIVGAGGTVIVALSGIGVYKLCKWGRKKLARHSESILEVNQSLRLEGV